MFKELAEYLGITEEECARRLNAPNVDELWKAKTSVVNFYQTADYYLFDLSMFEASEMKVAYRAELTNFIRDRKLTSGLDYGCGIGTELLVMRDSGMTELYGVDVDGVPAKYLAWRLRRRRIPATFIAIDPETTLPDGPLPKVDLATCVAVLEHVEKPREALKLIIDCAKYVALRIDASANDPLPMHLATSGNTQWLAQLDGGQLQLLQEFGLVRENWTSPPIYSTPRGRGEKP